MKRHGSWFVVPLALVTVFGIIRAPFAAARPDRGQGYREAQAPSVWPLPSAHEWYWHRPDESLSAAQIDAAMAVIKSGMFMSATNNWKGPLTGVSVSRRGIRLKYAAASGPSEAFMPLKLLGSLRMYYASPQPQGQKWLVVVALTSNSSIQAYFETEAIARSFIDAAASIATMAGISLEDREGRGFVVSDLTPAQAQVLGKTRIDGAVVTMIAIGGPAENFGLLFLDMITDVDGVKVRNADHFVSILDAAAPGSTLTFSCLERTEVTEGGATAPIWKTKTITWKKDT